MLRIPWIVCEDKNKEITVKNLNFQCVIKEGLENLTHSRHMGGKRNEINLLPQVYANG